MPPVSHWVSRISIVGETSEQRKSHMMRPDCRLQKDCKKQANNEEGAEEILVCRPMAIFRKVGFPRPETSNGRAGTD